MIPDEILGLCAGGKEGRVQAVVSVAEDFPAGGERLQHGLGRGPLAGVEHHEVDGGALRNPQCPGDGPHGLLPQMLGGKEPLNVAGVGETGVVPRPRLLGRIRAADMHRVARHQLLNVRHVLHQHRQLFRGNRCAEVVPQHSEVDLDGIYQRGQAHALVRSFGAQLAGVRCE